MKFNNILSFTKGFLVCALILLGFVGACIGFLIGNFCQFKDRLYRKYDTYEVEDDG